MSTAKMRHWPLVCSMVAYWAAMMMLVTVSIHRNEGRLIYPLDDTYIHMAVAKNLVAHHVWGVTRYEFTSSTSSPLWTLLLAACYFVFGVSDWTPLILDVMFGTLTVFIAYRFLARYIRGGIRVFAIMIIAVFATPLPTLTMSGMEHVLQALLSLSFVYYGILGLSTAKPASGRAMLPALGALLVATRYEGVFLVFVVCILFLVQGRALFAFMLGIASLLPVSVYGAWCVSHGWYFLPNSVLLKGNMPQFDVSGMISLLGFGALGAIQRNPHLLILFTFSLFLLLFHCLHRGKAWDDIRRANLIFIGCLLLHLQFARTGWLYRYEAYLVLLGVIVIGIAIDSLLPEKIVWRFSGERLPLYGAATLLILVAGMSFAERTLASPSVTLQASKNIYEQQYQMGTFLKEFYQGKTVALNDIGAVSYLADVRIIDLWGLGSREPARLKLLKQYGTQQIYDMTREGGVTIAVVYDDWFKINGVVVLPQGWVRVGQWSIPNNVVCGSDTISIYSLEDSVRGELDRNLRRFESEMPAEVAQYGEYLEGSGR
jgi:hypothetical protein